MTSSRDSFRAVGIAGQIGSGKTTFAKLLSELTESQVMSFGSFVRHQAEIRGNSGNRDDLQQLGEQLIAELGAESFVRQALRLDEFTAENLLIIDGVRHIPVWQAIVHLIPKAQLIYLNTPKEVRIQRVQQREGIDLAAIETFMTHSMELNVPNLQPLASLVLTEIPNRSNVSELLQSLLDRA